MNPTQSKVSRNLSQLAAFITLLVSWIIFIHNTVPKLVAGKYAGAALSEILCLAGVAATYFGIRLKWDGIPAGQTVFFTQSGIRQAFLKGLVLGSALIGSTYLIARGNGLIRVSHVALDAGYIGLLLGTTLVGVVWEELAFRGLILAKLRETIGTHKACVAVAAAFGLMHLLSPVKSFQMVLSTTVAGLLLNYAFVESGGIYFPIGIHFGWNFFNSLLYPKSTEYLVPWLAGRANPEEGLIAIIMTATGFLSVLWRYHSNRRTP